MITGTTRLYAIIGDPIAHVRTPMAFNEYFLAQNIDAVCLPIHIGRDDLPRGWAGLKAIANLDGFIVTAPHKADSARLYEKLEGDGCTPRCSTRYAASRTAASAVPCWTVAVS